MTALLFAVAMALFSVNNHFMLGLHFDEVFKVEAIVNGRFYYSHPLLMLETTRLAALLLGVTEPQGIVEAGRTLSALLGAVGVSGGAVAQDAEIAQAAAEAAAREPIQS